MIHPRRLAALLGSESPFLLGSVSVCVCTEDSALRHLGQSSQFKFIPLKFTHRAEVVKFLWEMKQSCQEAAVNERLPRESRPGVESHHNSLEDLTNHARLSVHLYRAT